MARDKISIRKPTELNASTEDLLRDGDAHSVGSSLTGRAADPGTINDPPTPNVWINEIHYDNNGADTNEGVEIAGAAGTNLSGWRIIPYNGSGGASYGTVMLSGTIPNQQNGLGTVYFEIIGLQNGTPDGLALVDNNDNVIQFLSYEGSFTATNGLANGMASTNIGVEQDASFSDAFTLQLQGTGDEYADFIWAADVAATRGGLNTGQTFAAAGTLAIDDVSIAEGNSGTTVFSFTVTRTGGSAGTVGATWTLTLSGDANSADFATFPETGTVSFGDGITTSQTITINVQGDIAVEPDEAFSVVLSAPTGGVTISDDTGLGTITNDDAAPPTGPVDLYDENDVFVASYATIQAAIDVAGADYRIEVAAGTYAEALSVGVAGLTINAAPGAILQGSWLSDNGVTGPLNEWLKTATSYTSYPASNGIMVNADGVTINGLKVTGFGQGIVLGDGTDGTTLIGIVLQSNFTGIHKPGSAAVTDFTMTGGSISDGHLGMDIVRIPGPGGGFDIVLIDGTGFADLNRKGIYAEALSNAQLLNLIMSNVGEFGGIATTGSLGAGGNGINLNLKYGTYANILIQGFTLTNVGSSDRDGAAASHQNGGAIVIAARDDAPSYNGNPATVTGVTVRDGTIDGTSTGIELGEPGKANATPDVLVEDVSILNAVHNALHGDLGNQSAATMTFEGTSGGDSLIVSGNSDGAFAIDGNGGDDTIATGSGNDTLTGGTGNDSLSGGGGKDIAAYGGTRADYDLTIVTDVNGRATGATAVSDTNMGDGDEGTDTLSGMEVLQFNNVTLDLTQPVQLFDANGDLVGTFATIQAAINAAGTNYRVEVSAGTYNEQLTVGVEGLTIEGAPGAVLMGTFLSDNGVTGPLNEWLKSASAYSSAAGVGINVGADGVTIRGLTVSAFNQAILLGNGSDGTTLDGVILASNFTGIHKPGSAAVTNFTMTGGSISDGHLGMDIVRDPASGGIFDIVLIDGTSFADLNRKGIYAEALSNAQLLNLIMSNVGEFGGIVATGAFGAGGNGINLNLKYGTYANILIQGFTLTNVGSSDRDGAAASHQNGGAIVIAARDDAPSYSGNPASLSNVIIRDGAIDGTSTGIQVGEPGKANATPDVLVEDVSILNAVHNALHGDVGNQSAATLTLDGTSGGDSLIASGNSDGALIVRGLAGNDFITTGSTDDTITGGANDDTLDGAAGYDSAFYSGNRSDYLVTLVSPGVIQIQDLRGGTPDGTDQLTRVERIVFADEDYSVEPDGSLTLINFPPVAVDDVDSATEDGLVVNGSVATNDSDPDPGETATLTYSLDTPVAGLTLNPDGSYSFDPAHAAYQYLAVGQTVDVVATYTVTDEHSASDSGTLTITVTGTNDAPVAVDDVDDAIEDGLAVTGSVATNDSDVDDGETATLSYALNAPVAGLTLNPDGSYSFDPAHAAYQSLAVGQTLDVVAIYTVTDAQNASDTGTLTITVTGINDAPVAVDDTNSATEDGALVTGSVAANDSDADDGETATLSYALNAPVAGLTLNPDGSYSFDPGHAAYQSLAAGQTLDVVATYTVTDAQTATDTGTLTITLTGINDAPTSTLIANDTRTYVEGGAPVTLDVSGNGTIADVDSANFGGGSLTLTWAASPLAEDNLFIINNANVTTTSNPAGGGNVVFVNGVAIGTFSGGSGGASFVISFNANATPAAVQLLARAVGYANSGGDNPTAGLRTIGWTLDDGDGNANGGTSALSFNSRVNVLPANDSPDSADFTVMIDEEETYYFDGSIFPFSDPENNPPGSLRIQSLPSHGTLYFDPDGAGAGAAFAVSPGLSVGWASLPNLFYVPDADYFGPDSFTFAVVDSGGAADPTPNTLSFDIGPVNDAAIITGDAAGDVTEAGGVANGTPGTPTDTGDLDAADVDNTNDGWQAVAAGAATANGYGTYQLSAAGVWTYTLNDNHAAVQALNGAATLTDSFTALTEDGTAQLVTITIHAQNDAAVITGTATGDVTEAGGVGNGTPGTPTATGNLDSSDVDSTADSWQAVAAGAASANGYGSYALSAAGVWTYTLDDNNAAVQALNGAATLTDSFTAVTADGTTQTVTITIHAQNDAAVVTGTATGDVTEAGGVANGTPGTPTATGNLDATDIDNMNDAWQAVAAGAATANGYGTFGVTAAGVWTYTLDDSNAAVQALNGAATLTDSFTLLTEDGTARTVTITIHAQNDAAVITGTATGDVTEAGGVGNGTPGTPTATGNLDSTDVDNTADSWQAVAAGAATANGYGTYQLSAAGVWIYTLNDNNAAVQALNGAATLTDTFVATAADGTTQTVTITIHAQNDAAVITGTAAGDVTEAGGVGNGTPGTPTATGNLDSTDVDSTADSWQAVAAGAASANGYGSYGVTAAGVWTYTLDDDNAAVQALNGAATLTDSFTVLTEDGTARTVTITIHAQNDAAAITGTAAGDVTEAGGVGNGAPGTPTATGNLDSTDIDNPNDTWQAVAAGAATANGYGSYALSAAGLWTYTLDDNNAAVQALNGAATLTDTFVALTADGTARTVTITIHAQNDAAVITGTAAGDVTEAGGVANGTPGTPTATGDLAAADVDNTADAWQAVAAGAATANGYGSYGVTEAGVWTYTIDDNNAAVQALNGAATLTDTFSVLTADGTARTVTITIHAQNDAATITGTATGDVTEAGGVNNGTPGTPTATGNLDSTDIDNPNDAWQAVAAGAATVNGYGSYGVTAAGIWTYTLNDNHAAVQALNGAATLTDTFSVLTADGTARTVTVTIHAQDDAAVVRNDGITTNEASAVSGNVFADNGLGADIDVDNSLTVAAVNGSAAAVGNQITLASGALLTLNANGTFSYDPNHVFDATPTSGSGAANTPSFDHFTYTLAGGGTATVTITITGLDSNDLLLGGPGSDVLAGGTGNDTYILGTGDTAIEAVGQGFDTVAANFSYTLAAGSEIELLTTGVIGGTAAITFNGNEFANQIWGNAGANILSGGGGNDILLGFGGNDILGGGPGADTMVGGTGDDRYVVDNAGDNVAEAVGEGNDTVASSVSYALAAGGEIELLTAGSIAGTAALNFTGNEFANQVWGNNGANTLDGGTGNDTLIGFGGDDLLIGGAGVDTMLGGTGNDTYFVENAADALYENAGEGSDVIAASVSFVLTAGSEVELMTAGGVAGTGAISLTGNEFANQIWGNNGANTLNGGGGNDVLLGFGGADIFAFTALGAGNADAIVDFSVADDTIALDDAAFTGLALGALNANAFVTGTAAADADDRIIYDAAAGQLYFDADGNGAGAAVLFATVSASPALTAADFTVI